MYGTFVNLHFLSFMSTHMSNYMSTHLSTHMSTHLSLHTSANLPINMSMHMSIHMMHVYLLSGSTFEEMCLFISVYMPASTYISIGIHTDEFM